MASVEATMKAINEACRSKGGHYATYSCKVVSWDDVSRGTVGGSLSCWGANITDTYLKSKTGQRLFTVRSDNWNEKLGIVSADEVAVVASRTGVPLQPVTLRNVLQQMGAYGSYAGLEGQTDLSNAALDAQCSIRFQTTFIPVEESSGGRGKLEFATEAYNYNTTSDSDPRNLVLLCTSQGMAVQQDGRGSKKLFHHAVEGDGKIHRYWLEAEESFHKVGGEQRESNQERAAALARRRATSSVIGVPAMGQRFNVLMTIQVPLQQQPRRQPQGKPRRQPQGKPRRQPQGNGGGFLAGLYAYAAPVVSSMFSSSTDEDILGAAPASSSMFSSSTAEGYPPPLAPCCAGPVSSSNMAGCMAPQLQSPQFRCRSSAVRRSAPAPKGLSSAARVSGGTEHDVWKGLSIKSPKRNGAEHVTVTIVIYNAVRGGVPTPEDVAAAIDDLEGLYRACADTGRLADTKFDFMKEQLKVRDMVDITTKVAFQPFGVDVLHYDVFPAA